MSLSKSAFKPRYSTQQTIPRKIVDTVLGRSQFSTSKFERALQEEFGEYGLLFGRKSGSESLGGISGNKTKVAVTYVSQQSAGILSNYGHVGSVKVQRNNQDRLGDLPGSICRISSNILCRC